MSSEGIKKPEGADSKLVLGINNVSNSDYHGDSAYLSSSNLKLILKDTERFYQEKVLGNKLVEQKDVFDIGSLTHTLILEPEKLHSEYAIFDGFRRQGQAYEQFKIDNKGKTIMTRGQKMQCDEYLKAYNRRPEAINLLKGGYPELTLASKILDVPVKARFDYINPSLGYIADVKTTGHPADVDAFRQSVRDYMYDLSAALYCQIAYDYYGKLFDFYLIVISKSDMQCDVYKLSSQTLAEGSALVNMALVKYKKCLASGNWKNYNKPLAIVENSDYEIFEI